MADGYGTENKLLTVLTDDGRTHYDYHLRYSPIFRRLILPNQRVNVSEHAPVHLVEVIYDVHERKSRSPMNNATAMTHRSLHGIKVPSTEPRCARKSPGPDYDATVVF